MFNKNVKLEDIYSYLKEREKEILMNIRKYETEPSKNLTEEENNILQFETVKFNEIRTLLNKFS